MKTLSLLVFGILMILPLSADAQRYSGLSNYGPSYRSQSYDNGLYYNGSYSSANSGQSSRQHIRSMHILDRPSRPGHFYGNAVRRRHASRGMFYGR